MNQVELKGFPRSFHRVGFLHSGVLYVDVHLMAEGDDCAITDYVAPPDAA